MDKKTKIVEEILLIYSLNKKKDTWLKKQSVANIIAELKSEIEELEKEIEKKETKGIAEEAGDVFWDVLVLVAKISQEYGIDEEEILNGALEKQKRRKPWLFSEEIPSEEEILRIWKEVKRKEREKN